MKRSRGRVESEPAGGDVIPASPLSESVRLELSILATTPAHDDAPAHPPPDATPLLIVFVIAADPDMRGYIRECLRRRPELSVLEAADDATAATAARTRPPRLIIAEAGAPAADRRDRSPVFAIAPCILVADEVPALPAPARPASPPAAWLAKPFSGLQLCTAVDRLLSPDPDAR